MKYLILTIPFLLSMNWMSESNITKCNNDDPPFKVYRRAAVCEVRTGETCWDATGKNCRYHTIQDVQVDDTSKPIYAAAAQVTDCLDEASCVAILNALVCLPPNDLKFRGDLDEDGDEEVWCTRITGYEQKTVQQLAEDATLKAAWDAAQAQDQANQTRRGNARQNVKDNWQTMSTQDKIDALRDALGLF